MLDLPPLAVPSLPQMRSRPAVYLDYHASTPCDPRVVEAMLPFFIESFANPSSSHRQGRAAAAAVSHARSQVAGVLGASPGEIVFTSGATESNNLAVLGAARAAPATRRKIIVSAIEHKAVMEPAVWLERSGFEVVRLPVETDGCVDLYELANSVDERTAIVSIQAANNEIGTIQPISEITQIVHRAGALFHCDAAQALGRIPVDVIEWDVDLLSMSGHKCYGPKGIGALYIRGGPRNAPLEPLFAGGGQEGGLRPGTLNSPGIVGLGRACELIAEDPAEGARLAHLRDRFEQDLQRQLPWISRNGPNVRRLPGNSSIRIPGVDAEAMIANLPDVTLSTGSACTAGALAPSHVLLAIGLTRAAAHETVRVGIGRFTMEEDLRYAVERISAAAVFLRDFAR
jgi:cysteine desulfurase